MTKWISLNLKNALKNKIKKVFLMASLNIFSADPYKFLKEVTQKNAK